MRNRCIVFIPDGTDSLISILKDKFRELLVEKESEVTPFEFRCKYIVIIPSAIQERKHLV